VMKCLEKQRDRRYDTTNGLVRDIQRYLADEPLEARPLSPGYRLGKFLRRNKGPVVAAGVVLLALLAGIAGTTFGLIRAEKARAAETERAEGERVAKVDAEARRSEAEAPRVRAEAGEKLASQRLVQVEAEKQKAEEEKRIAQAGRDFLQMKLLLQADWRAQANALLRAGGSAAEAKENPTIRELLDRAAKELAPDSIEANFPKEPLLQAELLQTVGFTYRGIGDYERTIEFLQRLATLRKQHLGPDHRDTLTALHSLAGTPSPR
jgi:eukaryotic-like serine/threonine-protein kinase